MLVLLIAAAGPLPPAQAADAVLGPAAPDQSAHAYYTELALMLGRLEAGRQLYRIGDRSDGGAHLQALAQEHLPVVRAALESRGLDLTVTRIERLATTAARSDSWLDVQDLHEAGRMALEGALREVDAALREDPSFKARVIVALAREAVDAYSGAVDGDGFVKPRLYQASWGYIRQGNVLLEDSAGLLGVVDGPAHEQFVRAYEALLDAWPTIRLPAEPRLEPQALRERLDALESSARRF